MHAVLGESCISCELQLAGPEYGGHQAIATLSPAVAEELFRCELLKNETRSQALSPDLTKLKKTTINADNSLSPAHTLLQIHSVDHKGLLYDIMRTLKDCNYQVHFDNFSMLLSLILQLMLCLCDAAWTSACQPNLIAY